MNEDDELTPPAPQPTDTPPHGGSWTWNPADGWILVPNPE